jgi:hypothetical protein
MRVFNGVGGLSTTRILRARFQVFHCSCNTALSLYSRWVTVLFLTRRRGGHLLDGPLLIASWIDILVISYVKRGSGGYNGRGLQMCNKRSDWLKRRRVEVEICIKTKPWTQLRRCCRRKGMEHVDELFYGPSRCLYMC